MAEINLNEKRTEEQQLKYWVFSIQGKLYLTDCDASPCSISPLKCHCFSASDPSSAPKKSNDGGKMTNFFFFAGFLLILLVAVHSWLVEGSRHAVGSQSWEALGQADTTVPIHKIIEGFKLKGTFKDHLVYPLLWAGTSFTKSDCLKPYPM